LLLVDILLKIACYTDEDKVDEVYSDWKFAEGDAYDRLECLRLLSGADGRCVLFAGPLSAIIAAPGGALPLLLL